MTNETRKPTRCCLTETILKKFFPTLEEPGKTNDEPGYTETFLGTIMTYPDGDATLIIDPELLDAIEWSDPSDPGAWIELPEGTVVTSHDRRRGSHGRRQRCALVRLDHLQHGP